MDMRTIDLELAIMREFKFTKNIIVPNVTNMMRVVPFETDMLVVTKSGYATGFEIKVSKSDLKADLRKKHLTRINDPLKGREWFEKYYGKFKHFYYVVPEHLLDEAIKIVPQSLGIYYLASWGRLENYRDRTLFNYKWSEAEMVNLMRLGTMRIYSLKRSLAKYQNSLQ